MLKYNIITIAIKCFLFFHLNIMYSCDGKLNFQQCHVIPQKYFAQETFLIIINADVYYVFFLETADFFSAFFD